MCLDMSDIRGCACFSWQVSTLFISGLFEKRARVCPPDETEEEKNFATQSL
jgi:hypothetical protein